MERDSIVKAVEELNEVLGLEPEIDPEQDLDKLKEEVIAAAELVEEGDEISSDTKNTVDKLIEEMKDSKGKPDKEEKKQGKSGKQNKQKPKAPKSPKEPKEKTDTPQPDKPEEPAPPASDAAVKITRSEAAGLAIRDRGKGKEISALIEDADRIYVENGGPSNVKESRTITTYAIKALAAFGAIHVEGTVVK